VFILFSVRLDILYWALIDLILGLGLASTFISRKVTKMAVNMDTVILFANFILKLRFDKIE